MLYSGYILNTVAIQGVFGKAWLVNKNIKDTNESRMMMRIFGSAVYHAWHIYLEKEVKV
jgi:hypothetical protein